MIGERVVSTRSFCFLSVEIPVMPVIFPPQSTQKNSELMRLSLFTKKVKLDMKST